MVLKFFLDIVKHCPVTPQNALSTMFLRLLVMFLHFKRYTFVNPPNPRFSRKSRYQLDFFPHIHNFIKKCLPKKLGLKNDTSSKSSSRFFEGPKYVLAVLEYELLKIDRIAFFCRVITTTRFR